MRSSPARGSLACSAVAPHRSILGRHSIRVSQHWRVCFPWTGAGPEDVEITGYHEAQGRRSMAADTVMAPVHPGEILLEEFLGRWG